MKTYLVLFISTAVFVNTVSCTRAASRKSTLQIQMPTREKLSSKLTTASVSFPTSKKLCFAANIVGPGIDSHSTTCGPTLGIAKGFVSPDDNPEITIEVPWGKDRSVELYYYAATDLNSACPDIVDSKTDSVQVYKIGQTDNLTFEKEEERVEIAVDFPGQSQNIIATLNLPATCAPAITEPIKGDNTIRISLVTSQTGAGISMKSVISSSTAATQIDPSNSIQIKAQIKLNP